jgi:GDP-L-fucose synthase
MNKINNEDLPDGFINIGTGKDLSIYDLAFLIKKISNFSGNIDWDKSKSNGTPRKLLDVSKITGLGWIPEIKLEDGVKIVYSNYNKYK